MDPLNKWQCSEHLSKERITRLEYDLTEAKHGLKERESGVRTERDTRSELLEKQKWKLKSL